MGFRDNLVDACLEKESKHLDIIRGLVTANPRIIFSMHINEVAFRSVGPLRDARPIADTYPIAYESF